MMDYFLYIEDKRYTAPTLVVVEAHSETEVREIALKRLLESEHHQAVEIHQNDILIERIPRFRGRATVPGRTPPPNFEG
jgi:hypothetical protein